MLLAKYGYKKFLKCLDRFHSIILISKRNTQESFLCAKSSQIIEIQFIYVCVCVCVCVCVTACGRFMCLRNKFAKVNFILCRIRCIKNSSKNHFCRSNSTTKTSSRIVLNFQLSFSNSDNIRNNDSITCTNSDSLHKVSLWA